MKTLILMRHGHASEAESDFERPLSARGRRQCLDTAQQFVVANYAFERILCSAAARASSSAKLIADQCGFGGDLESRQSLYLAQPDEYLEAIRDTPSSVRGLLLVAHNPGLSSLAGWFRGTHVGLGTADYAVIQVDSNEWHDLDETRAR